MATYYPPMSGQGPQGPQMVTQDLKAFYVKTPDGHWVKILARDGPAALAQAKAMLSSRYGADDLRSMGGMPESVADENWMNQYSGLSPQQIGGIAQLNSGSIASAGGTDQNAVPMPFLGPDAKDKTTNDPNQFMGHNVKGQVPFGTVESQKIMGESDAPLAAFRNFVMSLGVNPENQLGGLAENKYGALSNALASTASLAGTAPENAGLSGILKGGFGSFNPLAAKTFANIQNSDNPLLAPYQGETSGKTQQDILAELARGAFANKYSPYLAARALPNNDDLRTRYQQKQLNQTAPSWQNFLTGELNLR